VLTGGILAPFNRTFICIAPLSLEKKFCTFPAAEPAYGTSIASQSVISFPENVFLCY
jgi:hypothetical protein